MFCSILVIGGKDNETLCVCATRDAVHNEWCAALWKECACDCARDCAYCCAPPLVICACFWGEIARREKI
jgi:hypothetical protein